MLTLYTRLHPFGVLHTQMEFTADGDQLEAQSKLSGCNCQHKSSSAHQVTKWATRKEARGLPHLVSFRGIHVSDQAGRLLWHDIPPCITSTIPISLNSFRVLQVVV